MRAEPAPLRSDAVRNRGAIIGAAATLFASDGMNVTLERVAHAAHVGVGTVYRRFPTIDSLLELFPEQSRRAVSASATLVARARAAGVVREDLVPADLHLLLSANSGVIRELRSREASGRLAELMLEAYRSDPGIALDQGAAT